MNASLTKNEFSFPSVNGVSSIHAIEWLPSGEPRAIVQIAHGVAEYADRYDDFASFLAGQGFAVAANDHLGHGLSAADETELGWFGETKGWDCVVGDMKKLRDHLAERYPQTPLFLLGHSMGSFLARTYMIKHPEDWDGVILSGTGHQPGLVCTAGALVAKAEIRRHGSKYRSPILQKLAFGSYLDEIEEPLTPNDWLSRDPELVARYTADPLCGFTATAGLMKDMMGGIAFIHKTENLAKMRKLLPVFFLSGAEDPVGGWSKGVEKVAAAFKKAGMRDIKVNLYEGGRHEMLNETNKEEVYADILAWLEEKI